MTGRGRAWERQNSLKVLLKTSVLADFFFSSAPPLKRQRARLCLVQGTVGSDDNMSEAQAEAHMSTTPSWCNIPNSSPCLGHKHLWRSGWSHLRG